MFELLALILVGAILLYASYTDLKSTEVPDWLTHAGIVAGVILHIIMAVLARSWQPLIEGGLGLGIFVALGYLMYYTSQWGGGDSKILMAVGSLLGLQFNLSHPMVAFVINILLAGAVYGLGWTFFIAIKHRKDFAKQYENVRCVSVFRQIRWASYGALALFAVVAFFVDDLLLRLIVLLIGVLIPFLAQMTLFIKAVEKCMVRKATPSQLMEGDWIVKDVVVAGKRITGPDDLGISLAQIKKLQSLAKKRKITLLVKDGIPFVPSFLIAFVMTLLIGNPLLLF
ncbi:prepilin peptidase [Candidatus Woesearchaeota archaeon]|nr:prepilin peptidase [Candidatus Woesearchaeota archaeon]